MVERSDSTTYEHLGAHLATQGGTRGVRFAVWAPHAASVSVIGDWNGWDSAVHLMDRCDGGVWERFIPGLAEGSLYKFQIRTATGQIFDKADPYGFYAEISSQTASVVWDIDKYPWSDARWLAERPDRQAHDAPLSIYECHLGSWRRTGTAGDRYLTYRALAEELVAYVTQLGFTHIELLPITEHPFDGSWGYQATGYFAPTSRFGTPDDFQFFVDRCHAAGLGVILDWVPAHFARDGHGLAYFDGSHLYEHTDPRRGAHHEWGTLIFDYGRAEVHAFLLANARFWLEKYHIDGLRVDAVSSMLYLDYERAAGQWMPNRYGGREHLEAITLLKDLNGMVHTHFPGVLTIAEEATAWPGVTRPVSAGGLGFDLKWNMGWMHDILDYVQTEPSNRRSEHGKLTFMLEYAFSEHFVLPLSHDEVVHLKRSLLSKLPGEAPQKFATLRALYAYMVAQPGKKLLFMGGEFAQWHEWNHDRGLDWQLLEQPAHQGVQQLVADLNGLYRQEPALHRVDRDWTGFAWLQVEDAENSVIAWVRRGGASLDDIVIVCNWAAVVRDDYRLRVPEAGVYREVLNTDARSYGGSDVGNYDQVTAQVADDGTPCLPLRLPPLGVLMLKRDPTAHR